MIYHDMYRITLEHMPKITDDQLVAVTVRMVSGMDTIEEYKYSSGTKLMRNVHGEWYQNGKLFAGWDEEFVVMKGVAFMKKSLPMGHVMDAERVKVYSVFYDADSYPVAEEATYRDAGGFAMTVRKDGCCDEAVVTVSAPIDDGVKGFERVLYTLMGSQYCAMKEQEYIGVHNSAWKLQLRVSNDCIEPIYQRFLQMASY